MISLKKLTSNLEKHPDVEAAFITGSRGEGTEHEDSDLDLVVILKKNDHKIKSVYQWVDGKFADIFVFDIEDLKRIRNERKVSGNSMDGIFITWLNKADVLFDKTDIITGLKKDVTLEKRCSVHDKEKWDVWFRINHNLTTNNRYFKSKKPIYHEALEIRLANSVVELITGFLAIHGIAWRGEKQAAVFIKREDPDFYKQFLKYLSSGTLKDRFYAYKKMVKCIDPTGKKLWTKKNTIVVAPEAHDEQKGLKKYWESLVS